MAYSSPSSPAGLSGTGLHLLEVTIISAQDIAPPSRSLRTYAVAWVDPSHKLSTSLDRDGGADPTWNDKLVFRVDAGFLQSDTATLTVDILATRRSFLIPSRPKLLGTVRVIASSLNPSYTSTRFVALQARRPRTLRPQGILNVGLTLLDAGVSETLPLYLDPESPVAFSHTDIIHRCRGAPSPTRIAAADAVDRQSALGSGPLETVVEEGESRISTSEVGGEREMEILESKLEKWRTDLSPVHPLEAEDGPGRSRHHRRRRRSKDFCCFCGSTER